MLKSALWQGTAAEEVKEAAGRVYRRMIGSDTQDWGMNMNQWDWTPGVGLIAILHYAEALGEKDAIRYLENWIERNKEKAAHAKVINSMAPYGVFPELYRRTNRDYYLETAGDIAEWMVHEAPRTREGAFEHTVTEKASFPEQVWADTIFMAVLFLARQASLTKRTDLAQEALRQVELHFRLLQDGETGVLYHGWDCTSGNHMSAARWTRANAWIVIGFPLIVKELKQVAEVPSELLERYRVLVDGLLQYRNARGLWHTVMDRSEFYEETSGSAGIAAGILCAVRLGLLDTGYVEEAAATCRAVLSMIDTDGTVLGVSGGTPVMKTIEDYNRIPLIASLYGQGLTLMMLAEWIQADPQ
ncbi:glycoside hydrolase family 88 protein [Paenibacillus sp. H1-7]|uniref:glycoside hydrolase family 88/105 protein n=1 Tax=Paenibacillus sp. H1-7 TaxID=2282849 RepID=UPI001EF84546|nr:glycoside hydrolase family 88 protein [Paenibacillus sp. H1-7]